MKTGIRRVVQKALLSLLSLFLLVPTANAEIRFLKQNSEPKYFNESAGRQGLCDAVYGELRASLSGQDVPVLIDPELYPIKRILIMLDSGAGHVFCGAGRNAPREKRYRFSAVPVYEVSNVVIARRDETYVPEGFSELAREDILVGAYFGTSSAAFLKEQRGIRVLDKIKSLEQALQLVDQGRIRYFYYHDLGLSYLDDESDLPLKLLPTRFRTIEQWLIYSPHLREQDQKIFDQALQDMHQSGRLKEIGSRFLVGH